MEYFDLLKNFVLNNQFASAISFIVFLIFIYQLFVFRKIKKTIGNIPNLKVGQQVFTKLGEIDKEIDNLKIFRAEMDINTKNINKTLLNINNIKIHKYNPYADMGVGGNQSFSAGIINKSGDGVILTSLYSREKSRVLIKEIENMAPKQELSPEEKIVLKMYGNSKQ